MLSILLWQRRIHWTHASTIDQMSLKILHTVHRSNCFGCFNFLLIRSGKALGTRGSCVHPNGHVTTCSWPCGCLQHFNGMTSQWATHSCLSLWPRQETVYTRPWYAGWDPGCPVSRRLHPGTASCQMLFASPKRSPKVMRYNLICVAYKCIWMFCKGLIELLYNIYCLTCDHE